MQLDSSIVSARSAPLGSVVDGSATIATAWLTQKTQSERDRIRIASVASSPATSTSTEMMNTHMHH
jgi:hypothetical protein